MYDVENSVNVFTNNEVLCCNARTDLYWYRLLLKTKKKNTMTSDTFHFSKKLLLRRTNFVT